MNVLIGDNEVKYVHLRAHYKDETIPLPTGGTTIAFARVGHDKGMDIYYVSRADCSWRDNFCKKIGRSIAKGRLQSGMFDEVKTDKTKMKDVANVIADWAIVNG